MKIKTQGKKQGDECTIKCFNISKITFFMSPYKVFLIDSNGLGFYFLKCYYYNLWIIHVQSTTNLRIHILCENLYLM